MGDLERFIDQSRAGIRRAKEADGQQDEFQKRNLEYLHNSTGSPLEQLLTDSEIELCAEFLTIMDQHDHKGAQVLFLHKCRRISHPSIERWTADDDGSQDIKRELWHGKGYYIGVTGGTRTYLCTDNSLRCERSQTMFPQEDNHEINGPSWSEGVGMIPPKYIELETGTLRHEGNSGDFGYALPLEDVLKLHLKLII